MLNQVNFHPISQLGGDGFILTMNPEIRNFEKDRKYETPKRMAKLKSRMKEYLKFITVDSYIARLNSS